MEVWTEENSRLFLRIILTVSLFVIATTTVYGTIASLLQGVKVVGETLVTIEFPYTSDFPISFAKPITWLSSAILAAWFTGIELYKGRLARIRKPLRDVLKIVALFVAGMAIYEVLFNFTLWSSLITFEKLRGELNPDLIISEFPNPRTPWNIVFATKMFTVLTITSLYAVYFLQRLEQRSAQSAPEFPEVGRGIPR